MHNLVLRHRRRRGLLAATFSAALIATTFAITATPATAQDDDLEIGEISQSNLSQVANLPRQEPIADDWNSDMAFWDDYVFQGSYGGFSTVDISEPEDPQVVSVMECRGGQGDPTVSPDGNLLFLSVDAPRTDDTCDSASSSPVDPAAWEGMRVFDISDKANPEYIASVRTDCGSHTHTLVPDDDNDRILLYISSYGPNPAFPDCQPPHDAISIVEVPLDNPSEASLLKKHVLFPGGGAPRTAGCHDITVFPEEDLAAGACMGEGVLMDISDPADPYVITSVVDDNFAFWHSATFTNDTGRVMFTDELGGGGAATCNEEVGPERGANAIFDIVGEGDDRDLVFRSYFKIPRHQQDSENCVAHNGSLVPVFGRDIMVQSWYQGGVSLWEFTDPENPVEIGHFERGPLSENLTLGGSWSAYWYNGYVYSNDITEGLDVLKITDRRGGLPSADRIEMDHFNPQTQYKVRDPLRDVR